MDENRWLWSRLADVVPLPLLGGPLFAGPPVGAMPLVLVPVVPLSPVDESLPEPATGLRTVKLVQFDPIASPLSDLKYNASACEIHARSKSLKPQTTVLV
jgi:hypothetical protein